MVDLVLRRLAALIPMFLIVSLAVFMIGELLPGDPAAVLAGGDSATPERIAEIREQLQLDDPVMTRYVHWLGNALTGDFGKSVFTNESSDATVMSEIRSRLPITFGLALLALFIGLVLGIPVGLASGMKPGGFIDRLGIGASSASISIPNFFVAMMLVIVFAVKLNWLPAIGFTRISENPIEWLKSMILPASALGLASGAAIARQLRAALIDVMGSNYVRTAWASGAPLRTVVGKHALKNAAIPAITVVGLQLGVLIGGTVVIEQVFSIPGLGSYLLRALRSQDIPVIQGVTVLFVLTQMLLTLLVDLTYGYLNPKVRVS